MRARLAFGLRGQHAVTEPSPVMSPSDGSRPGLMLLALLIAGVGAWMFTQTPSRGGTEPPPGAAPPPALPGFRSDAWLLPDEPLLGFVKIPEGPFLMGGTPATDPGAFDNERWSSTLSRGTVTLETYYLSRYEVTVAQFAAFVVDTGYEPAAETLAAPGDHPVSHVSWPDALAYADWLTGALAAAPNTPEPLRQRLAAGWRVMLPTEAQWEKAARGPDDRIYPWGDTADRARANFQGQTTVPVGSYACDDCPYGLADMGGNVWEWTRSPYQPYPFTGDDDVDTLGDDALWVMRGGSFTDPERNLRTGTRGGGDPGARRPFMGFRVVLATP